jgi:predicted nucleic acid-binding protein
MSYLLETDRVVDWLKGRSDAVDLVGRLANNGVAISLITYGEIYDGIYHGHNPDQRERDFERFLRIVDIVPLTQPILRLFARERGRLRQQGQTVSDMDLLIAATAIHHQLVLVTRNLRHYSRVSGLQIYRDPE